jgi:predicted dehydrogenase
VATLGGADLVMTTPRTVAISGCGAVTELSYAPVLRKLERRGRVRVTALFDPARSERERIGRSFPHARDADAFASMLDTRPELVVVASPPFVHAAQSIAALERGAAVLCEKPAALTAADAHSMATVARSSKRLLAVGMVRRYFPASRIVRRLLREGGLGAPESFTVFEGGPFRWPVRSGAYFDRETSGGGVLADLGPHLLDLLAWWLGPLALLRASDDAMGGVEANALLEVSAGGVEGRIRLSRDWPRPNEIRILTERGLLRWSADDLAAVEIVRKDGRIERVTEGDAGERDFLGCFEAQLTAVLDQLDGIESTVVPVADAVPVVEIVAEAYARRERMPMPWREPNGGAGAP